MLRMKPSILLVAVVALATLTASCGEASVPTPTIRMTLYESAEHGFSIEYPEGWTKSPQTMGASFSIMFTDPEERLTAMVSVEYKAEEVILADFVSEGKEYMESTPQFELISEGDVTIGEGISGYEIVGTGDLGTGEVGKFRFVILVRGKQGFGVGVMGELTDFDQQKQLIDTIVDSFELLPSYTFAAPAPSPGGTYTNAEHGFSITYPVGWSEYTTGQYDEIVDLRAAAGIPEVMVRATKLTEETTLSQAASDIQGMFGENIGDYELLSEGEITLDDGTPAYEFVFRGTMQGYLLTTKCIIVIRGEDEFVVTGYSIPGSFEQDEAAIDEVIHSFHLE